ncbi:MAG: hypothetical protein Q8882_08525 [Bacillota bacterium]|nr:hypothetical protein [Bacillota bacterium]
MLHKILVYIPVLAVAMGLNILLGIYNKVEVKKFAFDWKVLVKGIIKAGIVFGTFIGLAFCFDYMDLSSIGISPDVVMSSSIIIYITKILNNLKDILAINGGDSEG